MNRSWSGGYVSGPGWKDLALAIVLLVLTVSQCVRL